MTSPSVPAGWTDLGDGLLVRQSRVYWMNSVLLHHPEHSLLVDPGVLPTELDDLAARAGPGPWTLLFTHGDWDHVLGRPWWPRAPTLAHDRFAAEVRRERAAIEREAAAAAARESERWEAHFAPFRPDEEVSGLRYLQLGPWRLVLREAPGHSASMLTVHLPERLTLIAADMLSDIEIPILQQPCADYRRTLLELLPLAEHGAIETLIPGHGSIARGRDAVLERLQRDLGYLKALERAVSDARRRGRSIEETERHLEAMDYLAKHAEYSMVDYHRANVRAAWRGILPAPRPSAAGQAARPKRMARRRPTRDQQD